jgi:hypothetical protein
MEIRENDMSGSKREILPLKERSDPPRWHQFFDAGGLALAAGVPRCLSLEADLRRVSALGRVRQ